MVRKPAIRPSVDQFPSGEWIISGRRAQVSSGNRMKPCELGDATSSRQARPGSPLSAAYHGRSHNEEGTCTA